MFIMNASGISVCIEHSQHNKDLTTKVKESKDSEEVSWDNEDICHCLLHMQMHQAFVQQDLTLIPPITSKIEKEMPQPKAITYQCLLDFFSSRAPPVYNYLCSIIFFSKYCTR